MRLPSDQGLFNQDLTILTTFNEHIAVFLMPRKSHVEPLERLDRDNL
jgi:hypothetical protein